MQYDENFDQSYQDEPQYADGGGYQDEDLADYETRQWAMALHLSQFAGYAIPIAGLLAPILIWQLKKDTLPGIDIHGRHVMNWILSQLIYLVISLLLIVVLIGLPMLIVWGVVGLIFPIIGAIKASDGVAWKYPMAFRFF